MATSAEANLDIGVICQLEIDLATAFARLQEYEHNASAINLGPNDLQNASLNMNWLFWSLKALYQRTGMQANAFYKSCAAIGGVAGQMKSDIQNVFQRLQEGFIAIETRFNGIQERLAAIERTLGSIERTLVSVNVRLTNLENQSAAILRFLELSERRWEKNRHRWEANERRLEKMEKTLNNIWGVAAYVCRETGAVGSVILETEAMECV